MNRFWRAFSPRLRAVLLGPAAIVALKLIGWIFDQLASEAFLNEFDAWRQRHNVVSVVFTVLRFAETSPVTASALLAVAIIIYAALRSEYELRQHHPLLERHRPLERFFTTMPDTRSSHQRV